MAQVLGAALQHLQLRRRKLGTAQVELLDLAEQRRAQQGVEQPLRATESRERELLERGQAARREQRLQIRPTRLAELRAHPDAQRAQRRKPELGHAAEIVREEV